jgi:hypothetical protein
MSSRSDNAQVIFYELLLKNYRIEQNLSKINNKIYLELTLD